MNKLPSSRAPSCAIDKYIGSDFDDVQTVANNIESIEKVANNIDDILFGKYKGRYKIGGVYKNINEYYIYIDGSGEAYSVFVKDNVNLPYTINKTSPSADSNLTIYGLHAGVGGFIISDTPPEFPVKGLQWLDCLTNLTYVWTGAEWVETRPSIGVPKALSSIATSPRSVGLIAVVNGIGYLSVGTSSVTDWKPITN